MAHGVSEVLCEGNNSSVKMVTSSNKQRQIPQQQQSLRKSVGVMGSRRIFSPAFKIKVLDSYRNDIECKGNQRATARKYNIHRRQIQKWLQCEGSLRSCCADSTSSSSSTTIASPASSPLKEPDSTVQQHHHSHNQQQSVTSSAPALNLSLARLHGDELAVQQQPPPPPPPPTSSTCSVAAQALAQQQHQQAPSNYRFHGTAAPTSVVVSATTAGYPDFKSKVPIQQQQQQQPQHHYAPKTDYSMLYQPALAAAYHQQLASPPSHQLQYHRYEPTPADLHHRVNYPHAYESKVESSYPEERRSASSVSPPTALLTPTEIKTERASPDSATSHLHVYSSDSEKRQHLSLKREYFDEEEQQHQQLYSDYPRLSSLSVSPVPSHQDHLDSLPPSPQDSDGSTGCSSSEDNEMDCRPMSGNGNQTRRRSFSLRFKLDVLNAFHSNPLCAKNQRATARKYKINRRQVQKWLGQEGNLREAYEICGGNNRQRLGPLQEEAAVDLRTTELGQISPRSMSSNEGIGQYNYCEMSPVAYVDTALTPPYSTPGCTLSCCQETSSPYYACHSPAESATDSVKRPICTLSCCNTEAPVSKRRKLDDDNEQQPEQETPLCLVKPKEAELPTQQVEAVSSTVPSPPAAVPPTPPSSKKDAILFKPYLDNPVSKPSSDNSSSNNNNCQDTCNLNERISQDEVAVELSLKMPFNWRSQPLSQPQSQPLHRYYLDVPPVKSAFVRYPGYM